jgi:aspartyl-tRNA(Asn)/glutamyl-tRNA(Gln) amidotransferase subunit B
MNYKPTIGLEIHTELKTRTKMFCGCLNAEAKEPNINVCPICMGHPGTLPVINEEAVKSVIRTGIALGCEVPDYSKFDRKNYFYPDLPKGYQISQYDKPLCQKGFLEIDGKKIRITRIHLEEDTGRLVHSGDNYSLVDYNRAGVPLMELVTEPDIKSAQEAKRFAEELQLILRYLGVSDADMEKGQMRVEANISISKTDKLGTKVEIKNLNSFRAVEKGIEYETERQEGVLNDGGKVLQETRGWDDVKGKTFSQREKEEAHDYRYFPEPDLPPLKHTRESIREIRSQIIELPQEKRERFKKEYGLDEKESEVLIRNKKMCDYFEKAVSELGDWLKTVEGCQEMCDEKLFKVVKLASNYLTSDLQGIMGGLSFEKLLITPENFAEFITLIYKGKISSKIAKMVLIEMFKTGADPSHIIEDQGLSQITDISEIEIIVKDTVSSNPEVAKDYYSGKENALQYLIGQVMAKSRGKANPQTVKELLKNILTKP